MNSEFSEQNNSVISADVLLQAASLMNETLREKVHAELAPCTNDQFVQRYCQLDPSFADTMYDEFKIDVSDIHQEKSQDAVGKSGAEQQVSDEESLDEMLEQKVEVAGDSEIGDEVSVSNGER